MVRSPSLDKRDAREASDEERLRLLAEIDAEFRETAPMTGRTAPAARVRDALAAVPREAFVPAGEAGFAYLNQPLPIGHGQTISQPFIVALMTDLLDAGPNDVVLEIGTGSGYQAAVLSLLVARLYSIETVPELAARAARRLAELGYANVEVAEGDGTRGWPEHAPYDGIIVTAAPSRIPQALIDQLKPGGRLVIPVGGRGGQELVRAVKREDGGIDERSVLPVAFVPLVGGR